MEPKKTSRTFEYIVSVFLLIIISFIFAKAGMAISQMDGIVYESGNEISVFSDCFQKEINKSLFDITFDDNVKKCLLYGLLIWFIIVACWLGSKRKYIAGKEFGTATWSNTSAIKDLFADNIMKKEIVQAKKVRYPLGRLIEKLKVKKECKRFALEMKMLSMEKLDLWKKQELLIRKSKDVKKEYKNRSKQINIENNNYFNESFLEGWKPAAIKRQYEMDILEIAEDYQQKLKITNEKDKLLHEEEAAKKRDIQLKNFYSGESKITKIKQKYQNADALLTKTEHISIYNYVLNNNILIMGGAGAGKSRGFVLPNILQAHSSFVVTDPKGEILEKAGYFLEKIKGYKIRVLNLDEKYKSDGYNPFKYIYPERDGYEERVLSLIETIIINTDGGEKKGGSDPFWDKAERLFLQAIFFFVIDGFVPEEQNMGTVMELIKMLDISEEDDDRNSELDIFARNFAERFGEDHIGVQQYEEFRGKASGKTAKSIVISAVARLAPFRTKGVKRIFSYDSMKLEMLGEELTAIFVVVPPTDTTFNFIAGCLFVQMFQELQYGATQLHKHEGQRLPVPVRFILDEFANTCTIPNFVKILAYARSFGIGIVVILQSLEQIKKMYKDEWGIIIDNCNTILYLGSITHVDTLEYMSKLLGKGTYDKRTTGRTRGRSGSSSQNFDVIGRELMDAAEIRKIPKDKCLLIVGGKDPFYSQKYEYKDHINYKFTSDFDSKLSYVYEPQGNDNKENTHGEDILDKISKRANMIINEAYDDIDEIQIDMDFKSILSRLNRGVSHYIPLSDEELLPNDGTSYEEVFNDYLEKIIKEDEEVLLMVEEKTNEILQSVDIQVEEEKIDVTEDLVETSKVIISSVNTLEPIDNESLNPLSVEGLKPEESIEDDYIVDIETDDFDDDIGDMSNSIDASIESLDEYLGDIEKMKDNN